MPERRRFLVRALLLGAMVATLCRAVRGPNDWAEAHWLLDYRFGFVKRGLLGQLLTWTTDLLGVPVTEGLLAGVAGAMLGLFASVMFGMACGIVRRCDSSPAAVAAMVAFLTSPFVLLTGHLNGYFDHVFFTLGVLSLRLVRRGRPFAGSVVQVVALLVHESCIVLVYPAFVLAVLVHAAGERVPWRRLAVPLLLPVLMAGVMAVVLSTPPAGFEAGFIARLRAAGFVGGGMDENAPKMLAMPLGVMSALVRHFFVANLGRHAVAGALVLPTVLALLLACWRRPVPGPRPWTALAAAVAVLLPLAMHAVAWDIERIWSYSIFTAFAVAWVLTGSASPAPDRRGAAVAAAVAAIAANVVFVTPLMDDASDRLGLATRLAVLAVLLAGLAVHARRTAT